MGLFGINLKDENEEKRMIQATMEKYNKKLEGYKKSIDRMENVVGKLEDMVTEYESQNHNTQMSNVTFALDLKYLKEQGDQVTEQIGNVSNVQLLDLKKQLVLTHELVENLQQQMTEDATARVALEKKVKSSNRKLVALIFSQVIVLAALVALLLNAFGVIVF